MIEGLCDAIEQLAKAVLATSTRKTDDKVRTLVAFALQRADDVRAASRGQGVLLVGNVGRDGTIVRCLRCLAIVKVGEISHVCTRTAPGETATEP